MFGDDSFDRLVREFFGENGSVSRSNSSNNVSRNSEVYSSNLNANYEKVESKKSFFVIINFFERVNPSDLEVTTDDDFEDDEEFMSRGETALSIVNKAKENSFLRIKIPKKVAKREMDFQLKNGILEVRFEK